MGSLAESLKEPKNEQMQKAFYYFMIIFNSMLFNFTLSANKATLMSWQVISTCRMFFT